MVEICRCRKAAFQKITAVSADLIIVLDIMGLAVDKVEVRLVQQAVIIDCDKRMDRIAQARLVDL